LKIEIFGNFGSTRSGYSSLESPPDFKYRGSSGRKWL